MSRIGESDVERVAKLAHLNLTEEEKQLVTQQLNDILTVAATIQELDTEGVPPMTHAVPLQNVLRPDENRPSLSQENVLQNAPQVQNGHFRVPRILD